MRSCRALAAWALFGAVSVGVTVLASPILSEAATSVDTFQLKTQIKEWCQGNPKFFENINAKVTDGVTLTFTRDVDGIDDPFDVQLTVNNSGSADFDAIILKGLAFPSNKAGSQLQFAVSGVNPDIPEHFATIRGKAIVDKLGNLTKVTGTVVGLYTGTYTVDKKTGQQSDPTECFGSATLGTGKKLP